MKKPRRLEKIERDIEMLEAERRRWWAFEHGRTNAALEKECGRLRRKAGKSEDAAYELGEALFAEERKVEDLEEKLKVTS